LRGDGELIAGGAEAGRAATTGAEADRGADPTSTLSDQERSMLLDELARTPHALGDGARGFARSPFCGDEVTVAVTVSGDRLTEITWDGHGCTVSMAAAAALANLAPLSIASFRKVFAVYGAAVSVGARGRASVDPSPLVALQTLADNERFADLEAFAGIGRYPLRATCATIAWEAAAQALAAAQVLAGTEADSANS
jgi:nitrogen fixation protein NifU and related proteins